MNNVFKVKEEEEEEEEELVNCTQLPYSVLSDGARQPFAPLHGGSEGCW